MSVDLIDQPSEEMIVAMMEASCLGRPSLDDESYVLSIWRAGVVAMKEQGAPQ